VQPKLLVALVMVAFFAALPVVVTWVLVTQLDWGFLQASLTAVGATIGIAFPAKWIWDEWARRRG